MPTSVGCGGSSSGLGVLSLPATGKLVVEEATYSSNKNRPELDPVGGGGVMILFTSFKRAPI